MLASLQIFQTFDLSTVFYRLSMDNVDNYFDEFKQNEIDVDKQTLSFHINTINQHRDLYCEMNTRGLNLEQVYRDINVTNFGRIIAYLASICLRNNSEESIRHKTYFKNN